MPSATGGFPASSPALAIDPDGIGWLTFDDPDRSVNILAEPVMRRISELTEEARSEARKGRLKALVLFSGKPGFIAGADVTAIAAMEDPGEGEDASRLGQEIFGELGSLPVPTIAAIDGICLGGGLEIALACDYRIASDNPKTRLGLPEVMLGILPAWGGTTRLPRIVGLQAGLDLILTGRRISSSKAHRIGLVDDVLPAPIFRDGTAELAREIVAGRQPRRKDRRRIPTRLLDDTGIGRSIVLRAARKRVMARTGGHYPAPLKILDVLAATTGRTVEAGLEHEAVAAGELIVSSVSKNLIHVFHLREHARKRFGADGEEIVARPVVRLGVLGAGVMGGGVAQLAASRDVAVHMKDIRHDAVQSGLRHARELFDKAAKRRRMTRREAEARMGLITGGLDYDGFRGLDLVVEAVVEKLDIKKIVLRETEERVGRGCVIASNTSSLSIDAMAQALSRPADFGGLHFFNPVHRMPLVEVVRGARTSDETVATLYAFALALGKVPVVTADGPGFLVNRILGPYMNEAGHLLAEGASIEAVDRAAVDFGMPMGPLRLVDEVGIDVSRHAGAAMYDALGPRLKPSAPFVAIADTGRLGRKAGLGFYRYDKGEEAGVDPDVYVALGGAVPDTRTDLGSREIRGRLVLSMINEAARALEDRVVERAGEVDLAMIMGTGFPPFRGGLLRFADSIHPRTVCSRLRDLHQEHGDRFAPATLIEDLAKTDGSFYQMFGG